MGNQWWLRTQDDTFGPETKERLLEWAKMGRIQPGQEVSNDGETWRPATEVPFLDMRWSIDIGDGLPRGPFNKQAAQALLASGRLPNGSRLVEIAPPQVEEAPKPDKAASPQAVEEVVEPVKAESASEPVPPEPAATTEEVESLRREIETLKAGLHAAEARAADAEKSAAVAREEKKSALKAADLAEGHLAEAQKTSVGLESRLVALQKEIEQKDSEIERLHQAFNQQESDTRKQLAERDSALSEKNSALAKRDDQLQLLSDEIKRLPPTAQLAADAQAAIYAIMQDEVAELTAALDAENREAEALREYRRARTERLLARRQEILRHIGTDENDMTRRALLDHPEDPRTVHLRQEMEALRLLQERMALESERKVRDLSEKLRASTAEAEHLRAQAVDVTVVYRQLQEARERLQRREKDLADERRRSEEIQLQHKAEQQALLARLSALEMGLPGATHQSREARSVRLAPWMGLKQ